MSTPGAPTPEEKEFYNLQVHSRNRLVLMIMEARKVLKEGMTQVNDPNQVISKALFLLGDKP